MISHFLSLPQIERDPLFNFVRGLQQLQTLDPLIQSWIH